MASQKLDSRFAIAVLLLIAGTVGIWMWATNYWVVQVDGISVPVIRKKVDIQVEELTLEDGRQVHRVSSEIYNYSFVFPLEVSWKITKWPTVNSPHQIVFEQGVLGNSEVSFQMVNEILDRDQLSDDTITNAVENTELFGREVVLISETSLTGSVLKIEFTQDDKTFTIMDFVPDSLSENSGSAEFWDIAEWILTTFSTG